MFPVDRSPKSFRRCRHIKVRDADFLQRIEGGI